MKVLHVIPSLSPELGGPTKVALNIVKALREQGIDAEIATTNDNGADILDVPLNQLTEYYNVPVWFLPRFEPPMKEFLFSTALTKWLWRHIGDYDILDNHYLFSYASTCAGAIARWQKVPYTVRTQGQLTPWALGQSRLKKQIYTSLIERRNLNHAAAIHCTTSGEAEDVRNFGIQTPTITLPLGVNKPEIIPAAKKELCSLYNIPADKPIVLFLSRLHYKKRPDLLIESLGELAKLGQQFHLIMAGSGEDNYVNYLQNVVQQNNLKESTSFVGFVSGRSKDLLLQGSDIFALPSYSENFGIVVAESAIARLPIIITSEVQIAPDIASANAGLIIQGTKEQLTQALSQLLTSPELRSQMGKNAHKLASKQYSWQAIATQLTSFYEEIISQKTVGNQLKNLIPHP
ncbi:MAG: glycosyltransferase [Pleurocapsa sp.]